MRRLYTFALYLFVPFILFRLYWKGRRLPAYRQRIRERFALNKLPINQVDIWIHAVSLGEVVAAIPLIDAMLAKQWQVLVTTMTPTGSERVIARFGNQVHHQYVPYDLPWALRCFFKKINTRMGIIMETELWPNLIYQAKAMKIPLVLANARISDQAYTSYQKVKFFFKPVLTQFDAILAQSPEDAQRFINLGAPSDRVAMFGNMKFDLQMTIPNDKNFNQFKLNWGKNRPVLIAASTHDDEERQLLNRLPQLKEAIPELLLLIAPRHPERFQLVYELSKQLGFDTALRSQPESMTIHNEVVVADSLGELLGFYQVSDYAFVGGSLVPIGGHNVLEPIAMHVPVFVGLYMQNSKAICRDLCEAKAMQMVDNADALVTTLIAMHQNTAQREQQVAHANRVLIANQGCVTRYLTKIEELLA